MRIKRLKKLVTVILLGTVLFAVGCAGQPSTSAVPSTTTPTTTKPPVSTSASPTATTSSPAPSTTSSTAPATTTVRKTYSQPPAMSIDTSKKYTATFDTSLGSFKVQLFASESPKTVNNFVFLSKEGFYSGVIFHRIIKDFMIQGGDPTGTGSGGPGYKFADELPPKHKYDPGIVAMANSGPNTNGSQFFICTGQNAHGLDNPPYNLYSQFGQVSEGMDVVMKIASVQVVSNGRELSKPVNPPVIKSITITEQ